MSGETVVYRGGQVWTGAGFAVRDLATADGHIVGLSRVDGTARVVSLEGRYVVPAYGNAHTHMAVPMDFASHRFLDEGVFYSWNPNSNRIPPEGKAFFARTDTFDVALAQGGITSRGGHPESIFAKVFFRATKVESLVGDALHYGDSRAEIDAALDKLAQQRADFVKAYLLFSEEYDERHGKAQYWGLHGMNPAHAPYLVEAAKKRGLKVAFHAETLTDLRIAIDSGAFAIMHMPAYGPIFTDETPEKWALTKADARRIAESGTMVVTTAGLMKGFDGKLNKGPLEAKQRAVQAENLRLLARHGATILVGTDNSSEIFTEVEHLASLNAFKPAELLKIVFGTGSRLFPKRRIGCFEPGCEADFLVLGGNPVSDIKALRSIEMRIKAGRPVASVPSKTLPPIPHQEETSPPAHNEHHSGSGGSHRG
ncbi:MAG TPA: amidohydrolase family protein [Sphingomicrobium sp.]